MHNFLVQLSAATAVLSANAGSTSKRASDVFNYIDPLIGTSSGGKFLIHPSLGAMAK